MKQQRIEKAVGEETKLKKKQKRAVPSATVPQKLQTPLFKRPFPAGYFDHPLKVVDLFACLGGVSCGASQAGHEIVLGVDVDPIALSIFKANHTSAQTLQLELGPATEDELLAKILEVVGKTDNFHLHGSPPCTLISKAKSMRGQRREDGLEGEAATAGLVIWFLRFVRRCLNECANCVSWSMEEVGNKSLCAELAGFRSAAKSWFDFEVVNFVEFGVPQTRSRLIAGSPFLIDRARFDRALRVSKPVSVSEALQTTIPEDAVYLRGQWHRTADDTATEEAANGEFLNAEAEKNCRTLDEPAFTLLSGARLQWWNSRYKNVRDLSIDECLSLQTFPPTYNFPPTLTLKEKRKAVGNAVPPLFFRKLLSQNFQT